YYLVLMLMVRKFKHKPYTQGDNLVYRLRLPKEEICYFNGTIEAYEGLGVVRTIDEKQGVVEVWVPVEQREDFDSVLRALQQEIEIEVLHRL
ncbi:DUF4911 domain-containing protein, partial [Candidatus Sumerlaeota bacterium]|nr:DUF4911 domain-containing protein [Candidatus Sumerlaeota bacterium]